jgi:hypothetical protein
MTLFRSYVPHDAHVVTGWPRGERHDLLSARRDALGAMLNALGAMRDAQ